ncbi:unnamed protein product [Ambrosiozyma monospora]|uniref:Unnamed protein product n=1 Tax=Ambrosiozyma monospora TaxID=43982 RepID=A0ACB5TAR8_AMBMO|nr:unnamed protein product [Ambrosiozyma monospora]
MRCPNLWLFFLCSFVIFYLCSFEEWITTEHELVLNKRLQTFQRLFPDASSEANPFDSVTTERRLNFHYPYDENSNNGLIQKNIWQMWKKPPSDESFPYKPLHRKWIDMNPNFKYHFQTNANVDQIIYDEFKDTVPEIPHALDLLPSIILKADFSRYVLLFLYGGTYADLDVNLEILIDDWLDTNRNVGFVAGLEDDNNVNPRLPRRNQLETWFFKSKARHPVLRKLIATIVRQTFENYEKNMEPDFGDKEGNAICHSVSVMDWTGPALFTDVLWTHLNSLKNPVIVDTDPNRWNLGHDVVSSPYV